MTAPLLKLGAEVTAVARNRPRLDYLREHFPAARVLHEDDDEALQSLEGGCDVVFSFFALQHLALCVAKELTASFAAALRPGGILLFTYPTEPRGDFYFAALDPPEELPRRHSFWLPEDQIPTLLESAGAFDRDTFARSGVAVDAFIVTKKE